jgi:hypothetical protein
LAPCALCPHELAVVIDDDSRERNHLGVRLVASRKKWGQ